MSPEELERRFAEADRARLMLRRCTIEMRAAGEYLLAERAREAKRPHSHGYLDGSLIRREVARLAGEIPDSAIRERLAELVRLSEDPRERELGEEPGGDVHEMTPAGWKRLKSAAHSPLRRTRRRG